MNRDTASPPGGRRGAETGKVGRWCAGGAVFALALLFALPTLSGEFLSGDDIQLVLNHVLVNHPSLEHAFKLFTIVHRDLYQPVPLVSFSIDFVWLRLLGLTPYPEGPDAGAWLFHLTNVLIHAVNSVLVLLVLRRLHPNEWVARTGASVFAVHPLAVEAVAWLSGRMMMLSTLFSLAAILAIESFRHRPRSSRAVFTLLFAVLAMCSKVNVALPILMLIVPVARRVWPPRRWWILWGAATAVTALFTVFAVVTTQASELFEKAAAELPPAPVALTCMALASYLRHFVFPHHLGPWYPPPEEISWSEPVTWGSALLVAAAGGALLVVAWRSWHRSWVAPLGVLWFLSAVAPTLPLVPARRAVSADRYVYLPNVGLEWIAGAAAVAVVIVLRRRLRPPLANAVAVAAGIVAVFALLTKSWEVSGYYVSNVAKSQRIAELFPDEPRVWNRIAWAHYRIGEYEKAIAIAPRDLEMHAEVSTCDMYQVIGMAQFRLGRIDEAIVSLHRAIEVNPHYGKCYSRLGKILAAAGRHEESVENYRKAIEIMPTYNPAILEVAHLYRKLGRDVQAEEMYRRVLENNPYDVQATLFLALIHIGRGAYDRAIDRLQQLLSWMPENVEARTNLGVCYAATGRVPEAIQAYRRALETDPQAMTARRNLEALQADGAPTNAHPPAP